MAEGQVPVFEGPISVLIEHSHWAARQKACEEMTKVFREAEDEDSNEFVKYSQYFKKMLTDKHPLAQEKGLDAFLVYLDRAANAFK